MCELMGGGQVEMCRLVSLLPDPKPYIIEDEMGISYQDLEIEVGKAMPDLRDETEDCPACILAALQQAGIPIPCATDFNFKEECVEFFKTYNDNQACSEEWS